MGTWGLVGTEMANVSQGPSSLGLGKQFRQMVTNDPDLQGQRCFL